MASLEDLRKSLNAAGEASPQESSGLISADSGMPQPTKSEKLSSIRDTLSSVEPSETAAPIGGQLGAWDRAKLSFRRTPEARKEFLQSRGISPEQFDEQDANEGLYGLSPADLADMLDTAASAISSGVGEVVGGAAGAGAGLATGPAAAVNVPIMGLGGAMAGGAAGGAAYSAIRNELIKAASENGIDDSDMLLDAMAGALGPLAGTAIKSTGIAARSSKNATIQAVMRRLSAADTAVKEKVAGFMSLVSGADPAATKAFVRAPEESLKRAAGYQADKSLLVGDINDIISEASKLRVEVNKAYRQSLKEFQPELDQITFKNAAERVEPDAAKTFVDNAGNTIETPRVTLDTPVLKKIQDDYTFSSVDESFLPKKIKEIVEKPELTFKDFEILRQERNNLYKIVSNGNQDAAKALSYVGRLYDTVATELPQSGPGKARELFTSLNKRFGSAYNQLDNITGQLNQGAGDIAKAGTKIKQQATSTDFLTQANLSQLRKDAEAVVKEFAPKSPLLDKYDKTVGAYTADSLFKRGAFMRAAQATGAGSLLAGQENRVLGGALGATAALIGQAPGLGVVGGAALGKANPLGAATSKELLNSVDSRRQLGPALGKMLGGEE